MVTDFCILEMCVFVVIVLYINSTKVIIAENNELRFFVVNLQNLLDTLCLGTSYSNLQVRLQPLPALRSL